MFTLTAYATRPTVVVSFVAKVFTYVDQIDELLILHLSNT